ncbi:MAG TPA: hypothetical protein VGE07_16625, partial [Herpetosiphonaceae bacterium]
DLSAELPAPRWPFLAYLAERKPVLLHGSGDPAIAELVPRQSNDVEEFGNRRAVYAASDGIWPLFFAIVDRSHKPTSLLNACFRVATPAGDEHGPFYFFSLNRDVRQREPWREGMVYILPRAGFEPKPARQQDDSTVQIMEWASPEAVAPLAKISVGPADFPFLAEIRGHDLDELMRRVEADPAGFPWLAEDEI